MMTLTEQMQGKLLESMAWFHDFCVKNNLTYYAVGGTALGALRHNGFIPWDDDLDVAMPRDDYMRFIELMKNEKGRFILETPYDCGQDFFYPFAKLYDTTTTLIENTKHKIKRGIFLDIFPLDGAGSNRKSGIKHLKKIRAKLNLLYSKTGSLDKGQKFYKNAAILLFRFIPINPKKILKKLVDACASKEYSRCDWVAVLIGAWREREVLPKGVFGVPQLHKFENLEIYLPEKTSDYLASVYGNWEELPPKEKRISHHNFTLIDLDKPYSSE